MSAIRPFLYWQLLSYILYKLWKNVAYRSEIKSRVLVCSLASQQSLPYGHSSLLPLAALLGLVSRALSAICSSVPLICGLERQAFCKPLGQSESSFPSQWRTGSCGEAAGSDGPGQP